MELEANESLEGRASQLFMTAYQNYDVGVGRIISGAIHIEESKRAKWMSRQLGELSKRIANDVRHPSFPEPIELEPIVNINGTKMLKSTYEKYQAGLIVIEIHEPVRREIIQTS